MTEDEKAVALWAKQLSNEISRESHPREAQQLKPVSVALERNREIRVDEMKAGMTSCAAV